MLHSPDVETRGRGAGSTLGAGAPSVILAAERRILPGDTILAEKNGVSLIDTAAHGGARYLVKSIHAPVERRFDDLAAARAALESWVANGGLPKD
jgi:hypothetical protein